MASFNNATPANAIARSIAGDHMAAAVAAAASKATVTNPAIVRCFVIGISDPPALLERVSGFRKGSTAAPADIGFRMLAPEHHLPPASCIATVTIGKKQPATVPAPPAQAFLPHPTRFERVTVA